MKNNSFLHHHIHVYLVILVTFCVLPTKTVELDNNGMYVINSIKAVTFTIGGTEIVTQSDIKASLTGAKRTLQDIVFELLVYLDAQAHRWVPDEAQMDRFIANLQQEHAMTLDDLKDVFKSSGYTFEEGRHQLRIMQSMNNMFEYKILSNLIVTKNDVEQYFNEHPVYTEAQYYVQYAQIPFNAKLTKQEQLKQLEQQIAKKPESFVFGKLFWVAHHTIDKNKQFICALQPGEISSPYEGKKGFEIYRLETAKQSQLKPLAERYAEISGILKKPRYVELLDAYKKDLFSRASILYFP